MLPVALAMAAGACQPAIQSRQSVEPSWVAVSGQAMAPGGAPRFRVGGYSVARFRASVAARRWPLMDSHTLAHRYDFDLAAGDGRTQDVRCVLITISGDEARERTTLECTVRGDESWSIQLTGRGGLDGALVGSAREYRVQSATGSATQGTTGATEGASYYVLNQDGPIASVPMYGNGEAWMAPELEAGDEGAVAATVVALLVGRELRGGGR